MEVARFASERAAAGVAGASGRRSILFQAFGSEELGLVGSFHFCEQPTLPLDSVVAMLNFDMVGRLRDNTLTLIGSSSSPEWRDLASAANVGALRLTYSDANLERSDQYCFYLHGRPVLFLHTGLHVQYHTPFDDTELINEDGMVRVGALAAELVLELATRPDRLVVGANVAASAAP